MKINIRYLKLSKQFLCIQLLSVYIYRQEEREDDFESKTEISLSCQLKAGKNYIQYLYTVYITIYTVYIHTEVSIYRIYDIVTIYTVYIHTRLSLFYPDLSRLCQRCSRSTDPILGFQIFRILNLDLNLTRQLSIVQRLASPFSQQASLSREVFSFWLKNNILVLG